MFLVHSHSQGVSFILLLLSFLDLVLNHLYLEHGQHHLPISWHQATTSSKVVIGNCSLLIASYKFLGSMQVRSLLGFTTATILFTQPLGYYYFCIGFSIRCSISLISSLKETGTFRGGCTIREMLASTLIVCSLESNLGLKIDLSIAYTFSFGHSRGTLKEVLSLIIR